MENKVRPVIIYGFFTIQILTTALLFIAHKQPEFIYGVVSTTIGYGLYLYFENRFHLFTSNYVLGGLAITLFIHHFIGEYLRLYEKSYVFDKALHIFGTYIFTIFLFGLLVQILWVSFSSTLSQGIFVVLLGTSIGMSFEILEFVLDLVIDPKVPYQDGLVDTNIDMISDVVGAFIAVFYIRNKYSLKV